MDIIKRLLTICAVGAALLVVLLFIARRPPTSDEQQAPEFDVVDPEGALRSSRDFTAGPAVVCFWLLDDEDTADDETLAALDSLARDKEVAGIATVAINLNASPREIAEFVKGKELACAVMHMGDDAERLRNINSIFHLNEHRLPHFILVRPRGYIAARVDGPHTAKQLKQIVLDVKLFPSKHEQEQGT